MAIQQIVINGYGKFRLSQFNGKLCSLGVNEISELYEVASVARAYSLVDFRSDLRVSEAFQLAKSQTVLMQAYGLKTVFFVRDILLLPLVALESSLVALENYCKVNALHSIWFELWRSTGASGQRPVCTQVVEHPSALNDGNLSKSIKEALNQIKQFALTHGYTDEELNESTTISVDLTIPLNSIEPLNTFIHGDNQCFQNVEATFAGVPLKGFDLTQSLNIKE